MKVKAIFAVAFLIIAFACDNDPEETFLLTLTVGTAYSGDETDNWIIVHAEDGSLLASESFEPNQELKIATDKPASGEIMVTHLVYSVSGDGKKWYVANSYTNVERGKHLFINGSVPSIPSKQTGSFGVSVSNVQNLDYSSVYSRASFAGSRSWDTSSDILTLQAETYAGISKYIVAISDGLSQKYKVLNDVQPNALYSFSLNDMEPFDHVVNFTFPQSDDVLLYVTGSEPDVTLSPNSYLTMRHLRDGRNTIAANYLNILTNYETALLLTYPGYAYEYLNTGSIPDGKVTWPQTLDFNITEKSLTNFSATSSTSYVWRLSRWDHYDASSQTILQWGVSSASGNQFIKELPLEITKVHPALSLDKLKHSSTTFYTQSPVFESYINHKFEKGPKPAGLLLGIKIIAN